MGSALSKLRRTSKKGLRKKKGSPPPQDVVPQADQIPVASREPDIPPDERSTLRFVQSGDATSPQTIDPPEFPSPPALPTFSYPITDPVSGYGNNTFIQMHLMPPTITFTEPQFEPPPRPLAAPILITSAESEAPHRHAGLSPATRNHASKNTTTSDDVIADNIKRSWLWGEAIAILKKNPDVELDDDGDNTEAPVRNLIDKVEDLRKAVDEKRFSFKNAKGDDVFIADKIFGQLKKYAPIGDIALQHNPDVVALVWAGFRFLLDEGVAYTEDLARILSSLGYLSWVICCGAIYEQLYIDLEQGSITDIQDCLIKQYVSILEYLLCAKKHLEKNTGVQIMQSLSSTLADLLQKIRDSEEETRKRAEIIEKEAATMERLKQNKSRVELERQLKDVRGQLRMVETTLNSCHESIKRLRQFVDKQIITTTLDWVSTTQFGKIHSEHCHRRAADTCQWLTENPKFGDWISSKSSSSVLWLRGGAGTGKTILASFAIELLKKNTLSTDACVAYFYCSIHDEERSSPSSILRALLRQVCLAYSLDGLPRALVELKEQKERESTDILTVKESTDLIIELSRQLSGVWVVIDALDECHQSTRKDLFYALEAIEKGGRGIRIFVTGRNEGDIIAYMNDYEDYLIEPQDNLKDIQRYIKSELDALYKDPAKKSMVDEMKSREGEILKALQENVDGMFLSIHLRMQALARETTIEGVTNTLAVFPQGLSTMYDEIFRRIGQQSTTDQVSALKVIKWLYYAIDDFSPKTIVQAKDNLSLAADPSEEIMKRKIDNVLHVCCGLIVYDPETGILRFSHATVRQYLDEGPKDYVKGGQEWILDRCFSILTCPSSERPDPSSLTSFRQDLFTYSMRNWGTHLRGTNRVPSWSSFLNPLSPHYEFWAHNIGMLIPTLKAPTGEAITLVWAACYYRLFDVVERNLHTFTPTSTNSAGRTPLHYLAEKGDLDLLMKLVDQTNVDLNVRDEVGLTPLILAVKYNRAETVSFLLRIKRQSVVPQMGGGDAGTTLTQMSTYCDINLADKNGLTAIHHATAEGHNTVLEYILRDPLLNINHKSKAGDTALSLAVGEGNELAVQALLQHKDIDPNCTNSRSETPLITAARLEHRNILELLIEHERIDANCGMGLDNLFIKAAEGNKAWLVELLLKGKNIDIERRGVSEWTALYNAVESGSLEALKLLLSHGADVNALTKDSWAPLHAAAWKGRTEMVKSLLSHGADVNSAIADGCTALYLAAEFNHVDSVRELLSHGADIDHASDTGFTPLHIAIQKNSMESARELIAHGADVKATTKDLRTPLHKAAWSGKTEIIKSLLSHGADVNSAINNGSTALYLAAEFNHVDSVRELLSHGADIDRASDTGHTPLHIAISENSMESARELIAHGADVNALTKDSWAPLHAAAWKGRTEMVKSLLSHGADVNSAIADGCTALYLAAEFNHVDSVRELLSHGADIDRASDTGFTPLHIAIQKNSMESARELIAHGADVKAVTKDSWTPLHIAAWKGRTEIMKSLLSHGANIDSAVEDGRTALHIAAQFMQTESLRELLLASADVNMVAHDPRKDTNHANDSDRTALHYACESGSIDAVKVLLEDARIDVKPRNNHGTTPLLSASEKGYTEIFKLLLERYDKTDRLQEMDGDDDTHLLLAASSGKLRIVELVLERRGHDINHQNKLGQTALIRAVINGHTEVVKRLLREDGIDANIGIKDICLRALHIAAVKNHVECIRALLSHGIDVNIVTQEPTKINPDDGDHSGRTALHYACLHGSIDAVKVLLEDARIDVKCTNNHGSTPLLYASQYGHIEIVKLLLERYEKTDKLQEMDADGDGILMCAAYGGHTSMIEFLLERGGHDINFPNKLGNTVLIRAATEGHTAAVELLLKQEGIDVTLSNKEGKTASDVAKEGGYEEIMALLRPHMVVEEA